MSVLSMQVLFERSQSTPDRYDTGMIETRSVVGVLDCHNVRDILLNGPAESPGG